MTMTSSATTAASRATSAVPLVAATVHAAKQKPLRERLCGKKRTLPEYDADITLFATLLSWNGTVLPLVFKTPSFWLLLALHGMFIGLREADLNSDADEDGVWDYEISYSMLGVPTSLLVFFLVFYGSQCYSRFFTMYGHCVGIAGSIMCWVVRLPAIELGAEAAGGRPRL